MASRRFQFHFGKHHYAGRHTPKIYQLCPLYPCCAVVFSCRVFSCSGSCDGRGHFSSTLLLFHRPTSESTTSNIYQTFLYFFSNPAVNLVAVNVTVPSNPQSPFIVYSSCSPLSSRSLYIRPLAAILALSSSFSNFSPHTQFVATKLPPLPICSLVHS